MQHTFKAVSLSKHGKIPSGPQALWTLRSFYNDTTPLMVIFISSIRGYDGPSKVGKLVVFSLVNTFEKYLFKTFAFSIDFLCHFVIFQCRYTDILLSSALNVRP